MSAEPFFAGAIHGIRTWRIEDDLSLRGLGLGSEQPWAADGEATAARCLNSTHPAPRPDCECGLYALHPRPSMHGWLSDLIEASVVGVVEAWGRVELHPAGFRAEWARPMVLFAPAPHLVSAEYLEKLREVGARHRVPVVELPRPEHAREWCRLRGLGLSREVIEDTFLQGVAIRLRRTSRVSLDGNRLTVGVWPEKVNSVAAGENPWRSPRRRVDRLPGLTICKIPARGPEASAALGKPAFDPGRALRLVEMRERGTCARIELWDERRELMLGQLSRRIAARVKQDLRARRIGEVRSLCRTLGLRGKVAGRRWLTILIAPPIPIEVEPEEAEPPTLPGWDWFNPEPGIDP